MQDIPYQQQMQAKRAALLELWGGALPQQLRDDFEVTPAPEEFGYRLRMDYVCSDDRFGLRVRRRFHAIVDLSECHLIPPALFTTLRRVYTTARELGVPDYNVYHNTGFLRYLVVRRNTRDEWLLSLTTADSGRAEQIDAVAQAALAEGAVSVWWQVQERSADVSFGEPLRYWGRPLLPQYVHGRTLLIGPNTFFQNNIAGFEAILSFVEPWVRGARRLVDLYAGVGTIGICLADLVEQVFAAELVEHSVELARRNIELNGLSRQIEIVSADTAAVLADERTRGDVLVVDPPRAGLGPDVCASLCRLGPARLIYISCNAVTQMIDLQALASQYRIVAARGFDLFPQTFHCEQVAVLERR